MHKTKSLKTEILSRLVIPLIFFVMVDAVLSYFVTVHYVDQAYDRWLLDSARSLIQEIKVRQNKVVVDLPQEALEIFKWDEQDKTYFKIISSGQEMLAGDAQVPEPLSVATDWSLPVYIDESMYGEPVRVISMRASPSGTQEQVFIHVAETLNKRRAMMTDILLADLIPQIVFVVLTGIYLLSGLKRGLHPLHTLAQHIAGRSSRDLSPIPESHVFLEVRTLTDTINDVLEQLTLAIATQQRFIANAAHQLRTPLAGLKLQAERALREQDIAAMQPALMQVQSSADRMSHLTAQLLVLARSEPIGGEYELSPVDLCALAKKTCIDWVPKALQRDMDISFESSEETLWVQGDEVLLRELLVNLLDNAVAYGQGQITVSLQREPEPGLTVKDEGPGIPDTEIAKVFERFYRIPGSPGNGCGLGLAIVKEIAELHNAQLKLAGAGGTSVQLLFNCS
ncbi:MAG: sensor histidine kinase N-terminal domain-containing protein [Methylovulum sp.]|uniref:sensor histidine kinase n=1 Tax=Methylovulum sp. TaxID=1916980 RepID=UPI00260EFB1E|nr:sensor histidine kinase [Methylovulum sp.]MDD2723577.1 sensor histidine kinase N-terminal domain-containing protein [Methylovulum sp.]MDD5124157.1 sensor histidine kinase N-terminal domain-containing protein [Methylovulum sp.]